jgi:hypothetical protein
VFPAYMLVIKIILGEYCFISHANMAVHFPSWTQSYLPRVEMKDGITMVMTCQAEHQAKHIPVERQIVLLFLT